MAPALDLLKGQHLIAIVGGSFVGGASYRYCITDAGRTRAALFLETSHLCRRGARVRGLRSGDLVHHAGGDRAAADPANEGDHRR